VVTSSDAQAVPSAGLAGPDHQESRRRKVYGITSLGAEAFEELLTDSQGGGEDERSFNLRLAFARYLAPERRLGLLEQRRAVLGQRLALVATRARARRDDRYMRILIERQQDDLSRDVSWLDNLIQQERDRKPAASPLAASAGSATALDGEAPPLHGGRGPGRLAPVRLVPLASASQLQRTAPAALASSSQIDSSQSAKDGM
jgi:hypothetical protein